MLPLAPMHFVTLIQRRKKQAEEIHIADPRKVEGSFFCIGMEKLMIDKDADEDVGKKEDIFEAKALDKKKEVMTTWNENRHQKNTVGLEW